MQRHHSKTLKITFSVIQIDQNQFKISLELECGVEDLRRWIQGRRKTDGYTPYILRHTAATLALTMRNVDIYALALNLGNQMTTTEKFYSKAKPEDFAKQLGNLQFEETDA